MEPASIAARPAAHRSRRRPAAAHRPPRRARGSIARPRLLSRFSEARDAPLVLLVAPAGYGKTALLSEWAARDTRRFAWFDVCAGDDNPGRLLAWVKRTLHDGEPPTVVVVDNAHIIADGKTFEALEEAVGSMPSGSQLALASRCEPGLPVGSLRAQRRVLELRAADLALTRKEAGALLSNAGISLGSDGLDTVMRRTEGWPVGVYLAALSLAAQANVDTALSRFAGDDRVVADYLRDEVLSRLDPDRLAFLLHTSILGTLSGSLCDAVIDGSGSARCSTPWPVRTSCWFRWTAAARRTGTTRSSRRCSAPSYAAPSRGTRLGFTPVRARGTRSTAMSSWPSTTRLPPATRSWPVRSCADTRARTSATGTLRRFATGCAASATIRSPPYRAWPLPPRTPTSPPERVIALATGRRGRPGHRRRAAAYGARREQHGSDGTRRGTRGSAPPGGR